MSTRLRRISVFLALPVLIMVGAAVASPGVPAPHPAGSAAPAPAAGPDESTGRLASGPAGAGSPAPAPSLGALAGTSSRDKPAATVGGAAAQRSAEPSGDTPGATGATTVQGDSRNRPGWQLVFHEDFKADARPGAFLSTYRNFGAYPWGWQDTSKRGNYDPGILSVSAGTLTMHLYTSQDGIHHVAAPYPKLPGGRDQLYGRYSVRFRADPVDGYKVAWLLWPESEVWSDGEIDFPEGDLTRTITAFMHYVGAPTQQDYFGTGAGFAGWHVATTEWSPDKVVFSFDGSVIGTSTRHVPSSPMHYVLQTETELGSAPVPSTTSGDVQVDWVSIWSYAP